MQQERILNMNNGMDGCASAAASSAAAAAVAAKEKGEARDESGTRFASVKMASRS
jgi:hypothetical protein